MLISANLVRIQCTRSEVEEKKEKPRGEKKGECYFFLCAEWEAWVEVTAWFVSLESLLLKCGANRKSAAEWLCVRVFGGRPANGVGCLCPAVSCVRVGCLFCIRWSHLTEIVFSGRVLWDVRFRGDPV